MTNAPSSDAERFTQLYPDLASRALGGSVVWANDEFFAAKENLIRPEEPEFRPRTFGHRGQEYDGWETRRRRPHADEHDHDSAVVRLGAAGRIRGLVVDTSHFLGNYPPHCTIEALHGTEWVALTAGRLELAGGTRHEFPVHGNENRFTHVRLNIYPDGGVARLRVHGEPVPDPDFIRGLTVNLAALRDGARILGCSDRFYGRPENLLMPGEARSMGEGWETARRRDGGHEWVEVALLAEGVVDVLELDTSHFLGNAPAAAAVFGARVEGGGQPSADDWRPLLPRTALTRDTPHRYRLERSAHPPRVCTHLRLEAYPDGGLARFRALGSATEAGLRRLTAAFGSLDA